MPKVNHEIIAWARETAGLSREEAAKKLGFQDSKVSSALDKLAALESGQKDPTRPQLLKMAEQYRRPLLTFYLSKPPAKGDRGTDFRSVASNYSVREDALLDALVRDIRARQSMVRAVLEEEEEAKTLTFIGSHQLSDGQSTVLASLQGLLDKNLASYRAQANTYKAFDLLRESAERAGIFVLLKGDLGNHHTSISPEIFRGFSIADSIAPFVVINDQDARAAWSFTLLHEVTHLLLGQTGISNLRIENEVERFCDSVAGNFLLPTAELNQLDINDRLGFAAISERIEDFANQRHISRSMVAYQAATAGLISEGTLRQLLLTYREQWRRQRELSRAQAREQGAGPSFYVVRRHRLGNGIIGLMQRMLAADALSTSKAARILGIKSRQVRPLLDSGRSV